MNKNELVNYWYNEYSKVGNLANTDEYNNARFTACGTEYVLI